MCNAANVIFTLLKLVYDSFYFTAKYTLMVSRHYFTFSTLAPIQNGSLYCSINAAIKIHTTLYCAVVLQLRVRHYHYRHHPIRQARTYRAQ